MQILKKTGRQSMQISQNEDNDCRESDFRERMLANNRITGLLEFDIVEIDGKKTYEYRTGNMESMEAYCGKNKLNAARAAGILNGILGIIYRGSEYMLDEDDYIIDPDVICIDAHDEVRLAYFPGYDHNIIRQLNMLADYMMNRTDYHDDAAVVLVYAFYMKTKEDSCSIEELVNLVKEKVQSARAENETAVNNPGLTDRAGNEDKIYREQITDEPVRGNKYENKEVKMCFEYNANDFEAADTRTSQTENMTVKDVFVSLIKVSSRKQKTAGILALILPVLCITAALMLGFVNTEKGKIDILKITALVAGMAAVCFWTEKKIFGKLIKRIYNAADRTGEKNNDEETVLLCQTQHSEPVNPAQPVCTLVSDEYPRIDVRVVPFSVGSDREKNDFVLKEPGVSRIHMSVDRVDGYIAVTDKNSTNGTWVNGIRLAPNTPKYVQRGDNVKIGGCDYYIN